MKARLALQQGATIFLFNVFLMTILWLVYKGYYEHPFPILSQNNSGNIFYSFCTKWYVNQYCIFHIVYLFIYYLKITWKNTHKPYIFAIFYCLHVSSVKTFLLFFQLSYSDSGVSLSICTSKVSDFEYELNMHCTRVFSSPDIHISSFWIRIKRQVMSLI